MIYIIFALLAFMGLQDYMNRKERNKLIEAFMAKSLQELRQPTPKIEKDKIVLEDIPLENADPETFDKAIKATLGREPIVEKLKRRLHGR